MKPAIIAALFALLHALPAAADEIELDPQCRLAAKLVNQAIAANNAAGLNGVGLACFCKYNTAANDACGKKTATGKKEKETDPVKLCKQSKTDYEAALGDIKDLVSNPNGYTSSKPPRGWAGNEYSAWVENNRAIGMLKISSLREQLQQLKDYEALNGDYAKNCAAAIDFANGSFKPKMMTLSALGGGAFEDAWPAKKTELAGELKQISKAIENLSGVVN